MQLASQKSIENNINNNINVNSKNNCQTPSRASAGGNKEVKTPGSGKPGDNNNQIKTNLVQQKILKRIKQQNK